MSYVHSRSTIKRTRHFVRHVDDARTISLHFTIVKRSNSDGNFHRRHDRNTTLKSQMEKLADIYSNMKFFKCIIITYKNLFV